MTNYDQVFENDVNKEFYFNDPGYRGKKMMIGSISLANALERLEKDEYYTLVTYIDGENLSEAYIPLNEQLSTGELLATFNPEINLQYVCKNSGSIQKASKLSDDEYLLGPGPDTLKVSEVINSQLEELNKGKEENIEKSMI